ncbi:MAG: FkbM family methyltransferase [Nitrososphaerota archaeon]
MDNENVIYIYNEPFVRPAGTAYEPFSTELFTSLINENSTVMDIGANVGHYTVIAAKKAVNGSVISFEPDPSNFRLLKMNCLVNNLKNVKLYNLACYDRSETVALWLRLHNYGVHSMGRLNLWYPKESVVAKPVDEVVKVKIDLAKIDAEGSEVKILRGMKETIKMSPNIKLIIECNPLALSRQGFSVNDLTLLLDEYGFTYSVILEDEHTTTDFAEVLIERKGYVNLFCRKAT